MDKIKIFIKFIEPKRITFEELIEELLKTDDIDEVVKVMSGIKDRNTFIKVINHLLNKLSEEKQENMYLKNKFKKKKEKEVEELI